MSTMPRRGSLPPSLLARLAGTSTHPRSSLARSRSSAPRSRSRASRTCRPVPRSPRSRPRCRDAGRRAQLGLPLHVDARHDLHAPGASLPQPGLGGRWFMQYVADVEPNEDGSLEIMYGIDGRRDLPSRPSTISPATAGARPVRDRQRCARPAPERRLRSRPRLLPAPHAQEREVPRRLWPMVQTQAECATEGVAEPDQGIWEARGAPQHYVSSKPCAGWRSTVPPSSLRSEAIPSCRRRGAQPRRRDPRGHPRAWRLRPWRSSSGPPQQLARRLDAPGGDPRVLRDAMSACGRPCSRSRRADRGRLRPALPDRGDERRSLRRGGHVPHPAVLARVGARDRRGGAAGARSHGTAAANRLAARALRRGVRRHDRATPRQLPQAFSHPR